jgi:hypothetical protein
MLQNSFININGTAMNLGSSYAINASGISGLGTASTKDIPASGDASTTQVVYGTDTRLTNSRTPNTHASTHASGGSDALSLSASQISSGTLTVGQGGTGATAFTSGNALIGNGTGAVTTVLVANDGSASAIVKSGTAGLITTGSAGLAIKGSASGTSTLTAFSTGGGTQVIPPQAGTLVSTGMINSNAQVTYSMLSPAPSSTGGNSTLLVTDSSGNLTLAGTVTLSGTISANSTTITATELSYIDGVTSNLQTQLNAKAPTASPTFTGTVTNSDTISGGGITGASISSSSIYDNVTLGSSPYTTVGTVALGLTAWNSWTPTLSWTLNGFSNSSEYKTVGKTVYFNFSVSSTGTITPSGTFTFTLPVQPTQGGYVYGNWQVGSVNYPISASFNPVNTTASVSVPTATSTTANTALSSLALTSSIIPLGTVTTSANRSINISGFYEVA